MELAAVEPLIRHASSEPELGGRKSRNLLALAAAGFPVPEFLVIPTPLAEALLRSDGVPDSGLIEETVRVVAKSLPASLYAVRSNATAEDRPESSLAGQYHTELAVPPSSLASALAAVAKQAFARQNGTLAGFSMIVQVYLEADCSGVVFTRSPEMGRETVYEFSAGASGDVVGGSITPQRVRVLRDSAIRVTPGIPPLALILQVEAHFGCPQDIEWCRCGDDFSILQSRPITTLSSLHQQYFAELERILPRGTKYYFEKTGVTELAPRPSAATLSLLRAIYAPGGPVDRTYRRYRIRYSDTGFLALLGGELYCDRERELHSLFPAMAYRGGASSKPALTVASPRELWATVLNGTRLSMLSLRRLETLSEQLVTLLASEPPAQVPLNEALRWFLARYETVFEVNLLAEAAASRLTHALRGADCSAAELLSGVADASRQPRQPLGCTGNSLALERNEPFCCASPEQRSESLLNNSTWYRQLSGARRTFVARTLETATRLQAMREYGRWLTVHSVAPLRAAVAERAKSLALSFEDALLYSLEELLNGIPAAPETAARRAAAARFAGIAGPEIVSCPLPPESHQTTKGLAPGAATAAVVERASLAEREEPEERPILWTESLTPDLVEYFPKISGIVARHGGLLSHLAIMARESGIPVVVVAPWSAELRAAELARREAGLRLSIDGRTGSVRICSSRH